MGIPAKEQPGAPRTHGRRTRRVALAPLATARRQQLLDAALRAAPLAAVVVDLRGRVLFANPATTRLTGWSERDLVGRAWFSEASAGEYGSDLRRLFREALRSRTAPPVVELPLRARDGNVLKIRWSTALVRDHVGTVVALACFGEDITEPAKLWAARRTLSSAVEHADEAIVITDPAGTITYVNPAYERLSGYPREEVLGKNPRIVNSGAQPPEFYAALWATLLAGETWRGEMTNRRKDGSSYSWHGSITPIRGEDGVVTSYVGVQLDVTRERQLEADAERDNRERAAVVAALERLSPDNSLESGARAICDALLVLPAVRHIVIFAFDEVDVAPVAVAGPRDLPLAINQPIPRARARYLRARAAQGPWAEAWRARREDGAYGIAVADAGVRAVAYVPLHRRDHLFGVLALTASEVEDAETLVSRLPSLTTFGAIASTRLARAASTRRAREGDVRTTETLIHRRAFTIHFQPIRDLARDTTVGFEALMRPISGRRPDQLFAAAHRVGLGLDLEEVALVASLEAANGLPPDAWLALNVSPELVLEGTRLGEILSGCTRPIVLEITEHVEIESYADLRASAARLGAQVRLAVDDAGAGFASMRHIVELRPDIVKVDIGLVHEIDRDPLRRAMVAGLAYFGQQSGVTLLAEGIETPEELAAVRALNVRLGQGYLLGRPAPASRAAQQPGPRQTRARSRGREAVLSA